MAAPPPAAQAQVLSCGRTVSTSTGSGKEEWCSQCDDWATVVDPAIAPGLPTPPENASPGKAQLWSELELAAKKYEITPRVDPYLYYAPSDGKGAGKVYGGFYSQSKYGNWYSVTAWGAIGAAKARVDNFSSVGPTSAREHYAAKYNEKRQKGYSSTWPDDGSGTRLVRCSKCDVFYSKKSVCHRCEPAQAKWTASQSAARKGR